ncbi:MAG: hypothetical protein ACRELB_18575, partial [Polyangiaceae bacterium]
MNQAAAPAAATTTSATRSPTLAVALDLFSGTERDESGAAGSGCRGLGAAMGTLGEGTAAEIGGAIAARMLGPDGGGAG